MPSVFAVAVLFAAPVLAGPVDVVNSADVDIVSLALTAPGADWQPRTVDARLLRKGELTKLDADGDGCRRDLRAVFADRRMLILRDVDVCDAAPLDPGFYHPRMHGRRGD
ncbi:MAG TPA: hypothetical protein VFB32_12925 [Rudaea sp.]|nr:hypothetical protein [Rudaea sp.]